jgi:signal transduction histidine kinase
VSRILLVGTGAAADRVQPLRERGDELFECKQRSRALGAVRDLVPDLVLLVASEPPAADHGLLQQLAADPSTRLVPVIHLLPGGGDVAHSLSIGASDAVTDEAERELYLARVKAALRTKIHLDELVADRQRAVLLELAGAVAHRLNQPLTSISVTAEMLRADLERRNLDPELLGRRTEEILQAVERMSGIIRRIEQIVHYRTVPYVGDIRILDLEADDQADGHSGVGTEADPEASGHQPASERKPIDRGVK